MHITNYLPADLTSYIMADGEGTKVTVIDSPGRRHERRYEGVVSRIGRKLFDVVDPADGRKIGTFRLDTGRENTDSSWASYAITAEALADADMRKSLVRRIEDSQTIEFRHGRRHSRFTTDQLARLAAIVEEVG